MYLGELKDLLAFKISDPNHYEVTLARLTSMINEAIREVVKDAELNQSEVLIAVDLTGGIPNPVIIMPDDATAVAGYENWQDTDVFTISDALTLYGVQRHISLSDGSKTEILQVSSEMIDRLNLHSAGGDRIIGYRIVKSPAFRMALYPRLATTAYPYQLDLHYLAIPAVLVDDNNDSPSIPEIYNDIILTKAAALCYKAIGKFDRAGVEQVDYTRQVSTARGQSGSQDIPPTRSEERR
jgi:hypothetical protein